MNLQHMCVCFSVCVLSFLCVCMCVGGPPSPPLAGDHAHLLPLPLASQLSGLPPLIIGGVEHVEDVPKAEVQALTGQPRVSALVVVKESSATHTRTHAAAAERRAEAEQASAGGLGLPDVERPPLVHPQRPRTRADAAAHHLLPQLVDLCLKAAVLCTTSKHVSAGARPHGGPPGPDWPDHTRALFCPLVEQLQYRVLAAS